MHAWTVDHDQEMTHKGALEDESGEQALDIPRGDENGGQHDCQTSNMASTHEFEALVTAVITHELISDCVPVNHDPTTVDSRTDEAAVGVVINLNVNKWKSYSP